MTTPSGRVPLLTQESLEQRVDAIVGELRGSAPPDLDTIGELAARVLQLIETGGGGGGGTVGLPVSLADTTDGGGRLALTAAERTKLANLAAVATGGRYADLTGTIPSAALPALALTDTYPVASQAAMLALPAEPGDIAIRSDVSKSFVLFEAPATALANWKELLGGGQVWSVAGRSGAVVLTKADVGLSAVDNVSAPALRDRATHTGDVPLGNVSGLTDLGRQLATILDGAAARGAIGAGTSSLALGTTPGTAKAGDYAPPVATEAVRGTVEFADAQQAAALAALDVALSPGRAAPLFAGKADLVGGKVPAAQLPDQQAPDTSGYRNIVKAVRTGSVGTTAVSDDTELLFTIAPGESWQVSWTLVYDGNAADDARFGLTAPTGTLTTGYLDGVSVAGALTLTPWVAPTDVVSVQALGFDVPQVALLELLIDLPASATAGGTVVVRVGKASNTQTLETARLLVRSSMVAVRR